MENKQKREMNKWTDFFKFILLSFFSLGQLVSIPLTVPHIVPKEVYLRVSGVGTVDDNVTWHFTNKSEAISVQSLGLNILIQTDRPMYKPGQLSMFHLCFFISRNSFICPFQTF